MNRSDVIKIAVADENTIIRTGVIAALKRISDGSTLFFEIARPADFSTRIRSYSPDVLIVAPSFGGSFDVEACRTNKDLDMRHAQFVALISSVVGRATLSQYDDHLSIFDSEEDLRNLLENVKGHDADTSDDAPEGEEQLSEREKEVVRGVVKGLTNKEIASLLNISVYTVLTHRRNIARKLQIHSSIALAIYAISNKIATIDEVK